MKVENQLHWRWLGRWILGLAVAALSCWLLVRDLDWSGVLRAFMMADYRWVAAGVAGIIGTFFTRTRRWQALLWHTRVPTRPAMTALLVGQVINLALPMRSGDVVRAAWIAPEQQTGFPEALGSIAVEKVWDLLALLVCGIALLFWLPLPDWFAHSTEGTALALAVGGGALWAGLHWQETIFHWIGRLMARFPAGWDRRLLSVLHRLVNGLEGLRCFAVSTQAFLWTVLTWGLGAMVNWTVLAAFGIPSAPAALFLLAALMVGGTVPVPGRLGLFEGICVISLAFFGIPRDLALAAGVVLHLVVMGPPLVGAALLALWPSRLRGAR
ncbi:MAG: lysylphosphatidylglycerol synthase transmembrane domain-containing protein [Anaerolineae bacterium]|nr:flippase-like domain-containing protein [Anaerolineae bacterium]MDW8103021.1 lysylphosphatidylglycerol synthase transmembrane domain-containing protein [Anaerolineae bacterium]